MHLRAIPFVALLSILLGSGAASAQDKGSVTPKPLPPLAHPDDPKLAAKELFARKVLPSATPTRVIGSYTKGCLGGAEQMPVNGDTWQVMRLEALRTTSFAVNLSEHVFFLSSDGQALGGLPVPVLGGRPCVFGPAAPSRSGSDPHAHRDSCPGFGPGPSCGPWPCPRSGTGHRHCRCSAAQAGEAPANTASMHNPSRTQIRIDSLPELSRANDRNKVP